MDPKNGSSQRILKLKLRPSTETTVIAGEIIELFLLLKKKFSCS